ncbi:hypothetical protein BGX38DRAFT_1076342, partial [Terfezia claveryi]
RRVWDIRANRVIPWTDSLKSIVPISHSWVAPEDIEYLSTSVNHYLWPVPLPRGVQLEDIRKELIQYNIWYAWLDVLCIRQKAGPQLPPHRVKECEVDLRLIGNLYMLSPIVFVYLSGLGRPF